MTKSLEKPDKRNIDWEAVEKHWRAGIRTKLEISKEFGVSRAAMDKRFSKLGIPRDLTAKINAKADAMVTLAEVTQEVTNGTTVTEAEIINVNAELQVSVRREHRRGLKESRELFHTLMNELRAECINPEELDRFAQLLAAQETVGIDDEGKRQKAIEESLTTFRKLISLPTRAGTFDKLINSLTRLIAMDRIEFGINAVPEEAKKNGYQKNPVLASELRRIQAAFVTAEYSDGRVVSVQ
ncbi:MAG: hypothetical protein EG825_00360 [Rhodocyclaceae bacterium]|nr:hypothetical protein [Rhodocyclaceae bacterium]